MNPVPGHNVLPAEIADFYIRVSFSLIFTTPLILIHYRNHEEQHSEDHEEHDDQDDVKDMEEQKTNETNEIKEDFERPQVTIAQEPSASLANDDDAFIKMGIQFVKAVRKSNWKLVDEYELELENYFQENAFSRSQKAALWSLLTSKL